MTSNADPLLSGVEKMLTQLVKEAMENGHVITDAQTGKTKRVSDVSFDERLKLAATCTKFLEAKKELAPPMEKPSDFQEMLNGDGKTVSARDTGSETGKKRPGRPHSKLPQSQFDPDNGRAGGTDRHAANGFAALAPNGGTAAAGGEFWDGDDAGGNTGRA